MRTSDDELLKAMKNCWDRLAKKNGLPGIFLLTGARVARNYNLLDSQFVYQPRISAWGKREAVERILHKYLKIRIPNSSRGVKYIYDYEKVWKRILQDANSKIDKNLYFGGVVGFDDTPRRGKEARVIQGESPQLFERYFEKLYRLCCEHNKEFLLLTAWNEWGEGAYLEPDTINGYSYLEALKKAVQKVDGDV